MADIILINPRFEVSYWGLEHALPRLVIGGLGLISVVRRRRARDL